MREEQAASECPICGADRPVHLATRTRGGKRYWLARCSRCGQHYTDPQPTADEIQSFYQGDFHQELRADGGTEKLFGEKFASYRDWILKYVKGGRSVDIGTATGLLPYLLKQSGFQAEGVEYMPESAAWGSTHYGIHIRVGGSEIIAQDLECFDLITMTDVLEHTEHPLRTLKAVSRSLKRDGYMLITFPDIQSVESKYEQAVAGLTKRDWFWSCCHIPLHTWEFTPTTARTMFEEAGFEVAGFRRAQVPRDKIPGIAGLLAAPLWALNIPVVARAVGTQMEFILRKRD